jgi:uncharacterized protein (DUF433 family)
MSELIQDRGRGPEITGTRITVYNLLQSFLDPTVTEEEICRVYGLTSGQVAAARAYVLSNPETVLAEHLKIEERMRLAIPLRSERGLSVPGQRFSASKNGWRSRNAWLLKIGTNRAWRDQGGFPPSGSGWLNATSHE